MRDTIRTELLVLRAQSGDAAAMGQLVEHWQPRLWSFARILTGDEESAWDVTQETWLAIVQQLPRLHDATRFQPWAFRITRNKAADRVRRQKNHRRYIESRHPEAPAEPPAPNPVQDALAALPGDERELLVLHYLEDLGCEDMAAILGIPVGTVKSRLHKARHALRTLLEQDHE